VHLFAALGASVTVVTRFSYATPRNAPNGDPEEIRCECGQYMEYERRLQGCDREPMPCWITLNSGSPNPRTFFVSFICGPNLPVDPRVEAAAGIQWKAMAVVVRAAQRNGGVMHMKPGDDACAVDPLIKYVVFHPAQKTK